MADDRRYSDEEFALILRTAAELASQKDDGRIPSSGLTLAEMTSAATQAGLDPMLVERAARMVSVRATASPFERLIGGPLQHERDARFPLPIDEDDASRLLSAVRISATHFRSINDGHASALGMTWQASGEGDTISLLARPDKDGTSVSVVIDRSGTFAVTTLAVGFVVFISFIAAIGLHEPLPTLAPWLPVAGIAGSVVAARRFWSLSTRKARERIDGLLDVIGQTLGERAKRPGDEGEREVAETR